MGYTHGTNWTDEMVKQSVSGMVKDCGLDRMPSKSEIEDYFKNTALTNVISKRYGFYNLAKQLGLEVKKSDTYFGKKYEEIALQKLINMGFLVDKMSTRHPYDLLVNAGIKIDVKASKLYKSPNGNFYSFNLEKKFVTCDIFILFCLRDDGFIEREYIVPSVSVVNNTQISIGEKNSKYSIFLSKWDLLSDYDRFLTQILKIPHSGYNGLN